jgi:hypothetical protein
MQKVVGSSPISRFEKGPQRRAFCGRIRACAQRLPKPSPNADVKWARTLFPGWIRRIMSVDLQVFWL